MAAIKHEFDMNEAINTHFFPHRKKLYSDIYCPSSRSFGMVYSSMFYC
jgi:hypothetical protein